MRYILLLLLASCVPAPATESATQQAYWDHPTPAPAIERINKDLQQKNHWLETRLALCQDGISGPVDVWLDTLLPSERGYVTARDVRVMRNLLAEYPVELTALEGLWIVERIRQDDWFPTIDEALIEFLGPARIASSCTQDQLAALRDEWFDEGYFQ